MTAEADTLTHLLTERHSCRAFLPRAVPQDVITRLLETSQRTASWCNSQAWQLIVTSGAATDRFRDALYAHAGATRPKPDFPWPREYRDVYLERRRACGFGLYGALGIERGDKDAYRRQSMENYRFFGAPHVAVITSPEDLGVYGAIDCGAYVSNFLLAAQSLGLATIAQAALATHAPFIREYFDLPADRLVVCGISFGYEDHDHPANKFRTARANVGEAVRQLD